ncbi:MAG: hypothetical protein M1482_00390, partial [Chloroflexi bacterium]|nr:hypothetical protein [Chloroflexota bacterium]
MNAVDQSGKRFPINWNGSQREMDDLAQKIANLTGAPVSPSPYGKPLTADAPMLPNTIEVDETPPDEAGSTGQPPAVPDVGETRSAPATIPMSDTGDTLSSPMSQMPVDYTSPAPSSSAGGEMSVADLASLSQDELQERIKGDPMDSDSRYVLGRKLLVQGQPDQAISLFQETMRL